MRDLYCIKKGSFFSRQILNVYIYIALRLAIAIGVFLGCIGMCVVDCWG